MGLRWRKKRVEQAAAQHEEMMARQRAALERQAPRQGVRSPGWYPDEEQPGQVRWWNGSMWTDSVRPG